MSIVLQSSGGGSVTIQEPSTASNLTANLPAATGTVMVSGNMPAFSASISANQSFSSNTNTKIAFDTKVFDTASCYNTSTYRFTPNVAGYYQINLTIWIGGTAAYTRWNGKIYKNGSEYLRTYDSTTGYGASGSCVLYLNGTTDYVEAYVNVSGTSPVVQGVDTYLNSFNGCLVRAA